MRNTAPHCETPITQVSRATSRLRRILDQHDAILDRAICDGKVLARLPIDRAARAPGDYNDRPRSTELPNHAPDKQRQGYPSTS